MVSMGSAKTGERGEAGVAGDTRPWCAQNEETQAWGPRDRFGLGAVSSKDTHVITCVEAKTTLPCCRDRTAQHQVIFHTKNYWGNRIFSMTEFPTFIFL